MYTFKDGLVEDYGGYNPIDSEEELVSHYNYDFTIADDEWTVVTSGISDNYYYTQDATIILYVELFAPNSNSFQVGTFTYKDLNDLTRDDIEGSFFFEYLSIDINPGSENEIVYEAISGTIVVTENSDLNYTLVYDVVVQEVNNNTGEFIANTEQTVSFAYSGEFTYSDEREVDDSGGVIVGSSSTKR
ncbi:MAG: hypothetical protein AAGI25_19485 [Bacteroidota bacterium]